MSSLNAELRNELGTAASRRARNEGKIPVSLYGQLDEAVSLLLDRREFDALLKKEGANAVFDLVYDGNTQKVIIKDFEKAALKDLFYFVDLQAVSADQKLEVEVPIYIENEETVKIGVVELVQSEVLVETTPDNIPSHFTLDVTGLEIGDVLSVEDLDMPANVELLEDEGTTLVSVSAPTEEAEAVDPDAEVAEPEVLTEAADDAE